MDSTSDFGSASEGSNPSGGTNMIGEIKMYAGSTIPARWLKCDGSLVSKSRYSALFNVVKYRFGGSGDKFRLPGGGEPKVAIKAHLEPEGKDQTHEKVVAQANFEAKEIFSFQNSPYIIRYEEDPITTDEARVKQLARAEAEDVWRSHQNP